VSYTLWKPKVHRRIHQVGTFIVDRTERHMLGQWISRDPQAGVI